MAEPQPVVQEPDRQAEENPIHKANREEAEAIDLEALTYESDFGPFLRAGVPSLLKRQALRKLWSSNPVLANVDGLNDYDGDFTQPQAIAFKSAWQVGRGYLDSLTERLEQREPELQEPVANDDTHADMQRVPEMHAPRAAEHHEDLSVTGDAEPDPAPRRVPLRQRLEGS